MKVLVASGRVRGFEKLLESGKFRGFDAVVYALDNHKYYLFDSDKEEMNFAQNRDYVMTACEGAKTRSDWQTYSWFMRWVRDHSITDIGTHYKEISAFLERQERFKTRFTGRQNRLRRVAEGMLSGESTPVVFLAQNPNSTLGIDDRRFGFDEDGLSTGLFSYGSAVYRDAKNGGRVLCLYGDLAGDISDAVSRDGCKIVVARSLSTTATDFGEKVSVSFNEGVEQLEVRRLLSGKALVSLPVGKPTAVAVELPDRGDPVIRHVKLRYAEQHREYRWFGDGTDVNKAIKDALRDGSYVNIGPADSFLDDFLAFCGLDIQNLSRVQVETARAFLDRSFAKKYPDPDERKEFYREHNMTQEFEISLVE